MNHRYLFLLAAVIGLNIISPAQTATNTTSKQQQTFSGPSAAGDEKRANGDFAGALAAYNSEITKIDADAQRIAKLKADYAKMGEYDKMNANTDEINKSYTDWAKLYYGRAMANEGLGKKADAKPDLDMAINLDDKMADAYYQRALLIKSKDNMDAACMDMSKAAALGNDQAKSAFDDNFCWNSANQHYKSGCSKVTLRQWDDAITELNAAIGLCPDSGAYYAKRGQAYMGLGKKNEALADFNKAIAVSPNSSDAYYQLGLYYFNQDDFDKAFDDLTKAINIDPTNYDAYMYRAQCCERQNKMTSAIYDYGQAISLRPDDAEAYYRRALIERDMKDKPHMCKDFNRAAQLGNTDAEEYLKECK